MTRGGLVTSSLILLAMALLMDGALLLGWVAKSGARGLELATTPPAVALGALGGLLWMLHRAGLRP
jgi:hypothetical protein